MLLFSRCFCYLVATGSTIRLQMSIARMYELMCCCVVINWPAQFCVFFCRKVQGVPKKPPVKSPFCWLFHFISEKSVGWSTIEVTILGRILQVSKMLVSDRKRGVRCQYFCQLDTI